MTDNELRDSALMMRRLRCALPALPIKEWTCLGEGWEFIAYRVNRTIVFKFPKDDHSERALAREVEVLSRLEPQSPTAVPAVKHVIPANRHFNRLVVGFSYLPGKPLSREFVSSLTAKQTEKLADELSRFFLFLHSFPYGQARLETILHSFHPYQDSLEMWDSAQAILHEHLPAQLLAKLSRWAADYFSEAAQFEITPALTHNDLTAYNILYDYAHQAVSGIIDFGNALITDPDYDIAQVSANLGTGLAEKIFLKLGRHDLDCLRKKIFFYNLLDNLYILTCDHDSRDAAEFDYALSKICKTPIPPY